MAKKKSLPKTIFVYEEEDGERRYLMAEYSRDETASESIDDVRLVGTYQLVEIGEVKTSTVYTKK